MNGVTLKTSNKFEKENEEEKLFKKRFLDRTSLHSKRLEVVGERENGRAREGVSISRARFFLCPLLTRASYGGYDRTLHENTGPNKHIR